MDILPVHVGLLKLGSVYQSFPTLVAFCILSAPAGPANILEPVLAAESQETPVLWPGLPGGQLLCLMRMYNDR